MFPVLHKVYSEMSCFFDSLFLLTLTSKVCVVCPTEVMVFRFGRLFQLDETSFIMSTDDVTPYSWWWLRSHLGTKLTYYYTCCIIRFMCYWVMPIFQYIFFHVFASFYILWFSKAILRHLSFTTIVRSFISFFSLLFSVWYSKTWITSLSADLLGERSLTEHAVSYLRLNLVSWKYI